MAERHGGELQGDGILAGRRARVHDVVVRQHEECAQVRFGLSDGDGGVKLLSAVAHQSSA